MHKLSIFMLLCVCVSEMLPPNSNLTNSNEKVKVGLLSGKLSEKIKVFSSLFFFSGPIVGGAKKKFLIELNSGR